MAVKRALLAVCVWLLAAGLYAQGGIDTVKGSICRPLASAPTACGGAAEGKCYTDNGAHVVYFCLNSSWTAIATGSSVASLALDNLASVNINTSLLFQTGVAVGSTTHPANNLVVNLSGTYGTGSWTFAGTPTGNRVATFPGDASFTFGGLSLSQTWSGVNTFSAAGQVPVAFSNNQYLQMGNPALGDLGTSTSNTPDTPRLLAISPSYSWQLVASPAEFNFDYNNANCGTSICVDPTFEIFSHNTNTAQWGSFWHDATNFNIKTGTGAVKISNHVMLAGTAPTLSACGSSPTAVTGSDSAGHFTVGSAATTCTLTFNATWSAVPECFENDQTSILAVSAVPTTTTITFTTTVASAISSQLISYFCVQGS